MSPISSSSIFLVYGAFSVPSISENSGDNDTVLGTSKFLVSNICLKNIQGCFDGQTTEGKVSCSTVYPCNNGYYKNINLMSSENSTEE